MFRIAPLLPTILVIVAASLVVGQEYLSECDSNSELVTCAKSKFLSCLNNQCQCEDPLNQTYDLKKGSCVLLPGRKCAGILNSAELLDPRILETVKRFPSCGSNAVCNVDSSECQCKRGYVHNEKESSCQLSFGAQCNNQTDKIIFWADGTRTGAQVKRENDSNSSIDLELVECDETLGLYCGQDGYCKCSDDFVWKIDQGCVEFQKKNNDSTDNLVQSSSNQATVNVAGNDYFTANPSDFTTSPSSTYGGDEQSPLFQQFVDSYTKALLEANNYYDLNFNQNYADLWGTGSTTGALGTGTGSTTAKYNNLTALLASGEGMNSSASPSSSEKYVVGERNQFPPGGNQNDQLWNLLIQQELEKNSNNNYVRNNLSGSGNDDLAKIQEQAVQLQKLLIQQQQLERILNQLLGTSPQGQGTRQPQQPNLQAPPALVSPQNNFLGLGNTQNQYQNSYPALWNQQQQQYPPPLFGGPFPLMRIFRNFVDPLKRKIFPNLADSGFTIPSPLYIAASIVNSILPVLRSFDQQFSPLLQNVIQLTKPRPRPTAAPVPYINNNVPLLQQLLQLNANRLVTPQNPNGQQQQYQLAINNLIAQRLAQGNGLLGSLGNGISRGIGRSLNLGANGDTHRSGRLLWGVNRRNSNNQKNNEKNEHIGRRNVRRGLWWW